MPKVQRNGDVNSAGAPVTVVGQGFVYANGLLVSVVGDPVASHGDHGSVTTSGGSSFVRIKGIPVIRTGDPDTCGHVRVGGSPNVNCEQ